MSRRDKVKVITKQFIIDQLTDNEVDLSMNELSTVPVKELALVTRGTKLDLSRNHLKSLPDNFGNLRHLIALDLSGNKLQCLPNSFGQLVLIQRLDLYSNQLTSLPPSFSNLKKLKWLDLKNNPLEDELREAAGTCVSSKECNQCATRVLAYMRSLQAMADRNKQALLDRQRLQEKIRKEDESLRKGALKKERDIRKQLRQDQLRQDEREDDDDADNDEGGEEEVEESGTRHSPLDASWGAEKTSCCFNIGSVCTALLLFSVVAIVVLVFGITMCSNFLQPAQCQAIKMGVIKYVAHVLELLGAKVD